MIDKVIRIVKESFILLDLFVFNFFGNIIFINVVVFSFSDYDMLIVVRKINVCKLLLRIIECRNYVKYNFLVFCDDLRDILWDDVLKERNVNIVWSNWKELFLNVCDWYVFYKWKIVWGVKCLWFIGEIKKFMN